MGEDNITVLPAFSFCLPHPTNPHLGLLVYSWDSLAFSSCAHNSYGWAKLEVFNLFSTCNLTKVLAVLSKVLRISPAQIQRRPRSGLEQSDVLTSV